MRVWLINETIRSFSGHCSIPINKSILYFLLYSIHLRHFFNRILHFVCIMKSFFEIFSINMFNIRSFCHLLLSFHYLRYEKNNPMFLRIPRSLFRKNPRHPKNFVVAYPARNVRTQLIDWIILNDIFKQCMKSFRNPLIVAINYLLVKLSFVHMSILNIVVVIIVIYVNEDSVGKHC